MAARILRPLYKRSLMPAVSLTWKTKRWNLKKLLPASHKGNSPEFQVLGKMRVPPVQQWKCSDKHNPLSTLGTHQMERSGPDGDASTQEGALLKRSLCSQLAHWIWEPRSSKSQDSVNLYTIQAHGRFNTRLSQSNARKFYTYYYIPQNKHFK